MNRSSALKVNSLRTTLLIVALFQVAGGAAIYRLTASSSGIAIPTPWRLASVLLIQAAVTIAVAVTGHWSLRQRVYAAACFTAICCLSLYFLYKPYVAGRNVDLEAVRQRVEGVIVIVNLCGFAVLNLLFAAGLAKALRIQRSNLEINGTHPDNFPKSSEGGKNRRRDFSNPYQSPKEM